MHETAPPMPDTAFRYNAGPATRQQPGRMEGPGLSRPVPDNRGGKRHPANPHRIG